MKLLNAELNRMVKENQSIKEENLSIKQELAIQARITESQRKEIDNYKQLINETDSKIELQQKRKSNNYDKINLDDFVDIDQQLLHRRKK